MELEKHKIEKKFEKFSHVERLSERAISTATSLKKEKVTTTAK